MAAVVAVNRFGPDQFPVDPALGSTGYIDGGLLVSPSAGSGTSVGTVVATPTTGSPQVLGVNLQPAVSSAYVSSSIPGYGGAQLDYSIPDNYAVVAWQGTYKLTWDGSGSNKLGALVYVSKLVDGQVGFDSTSSPTLIGVCVDPNAASATSGSQILVRFTGNVS
jgi:predicted RecA/RadA family phage recombinase